MKQKKVFLVKWLPMRSDYYAICLFGLIFSVRPLSAVELNHERIHVAQQRELLNIPFLIWYGVEWLLLLIKYRDTLKAYYHIRFEREAYAHQADLHYLDHRKHFHYQ